jgi:hypothetical protein
MATLLSNLGKMISDLINILYSVTNIIYSAIDFLPDEIKFTFITVLSIAVAVFIYKLIK